MITSISCLLGEEDSKTSIKEELKSFEEAGTSIGLEPDNSASFKDNPMDFSLHGVWSFLPALMPYIICVL